MTDQAHPKTPAHLRGLVSELEEVGDWFTARKGKQYHRRTLNATFPHVRHLDRILENLVACGHIARVYSTVHDTTRAPGAYYGAL